jgi:hypothetical protein
MAFYRRVADLYHNQAQMATKVEEVVLTPDLKSWESVLRIYSYPKPLWDWLIDTALVFHRLVRGLDEVDWSTEFKKPYEHIEPEELY